MSIINSMKEALSNPNHQNCTELICNLISGEKSLVVPQNKKAQIIEKGTHTKTLIPGKHQIPAHAEVKFVTTVEVPQNQMGLVYLNGKLSAVYPCGYYDIDEAASFTTVNGQALISSALLEQIKNLSGDAQNLVTVFSIKANQAAVLQNQNMSLYDNYTTPGTYAHWKQFVNIQILNLDAPPSQLPRELLNKLQDLLKTSCLSANEIAVHKVDDKFEDVLAPESYSIFWNIHHSHTFDVIKLDGHMFDETKEEHFKALEQYLEHYTIDENHFGVLKKGNEIQTILTRPGIYTYWKSVNTPHTFTIIEINDGFVSNETSQLLGTQHASVNNNAKEYLYHRLHGSGILLVNNEFRKYYANGEECLFWDERIHQINDTKKFVAAPAIDQILIMELKDQNMLTKDNACLKINAICHYSIHDYQDFCRCNDIYDRDLDVLNHPLGKKDAYESVKSLYLQFQIVLRNYVSEHTLDEVLASRQNIVSTIFEQLKGMESEFGVIIQRISIKDFMFNSAYQEMQNQVLLAEKKAQIKAIERREEVNNNRTLLNTAKLMQENKMMYDLRKLETFEKVCSGSREIKLAMQQFMENKN